MNTYSMLDNKNDPFNVIVIRHINFARIDPNDPKTVQIFFTGTIQHFAMRDADQAKEMLAMIIKSLNNEA